MWEKRPWYEKGKPKTFNIGRLGSCSIICTAMVVEEQNTEGAGMAGCARQDSFIGIPSHNKGKMWLPFWNKSKKTKNK